MATTGALEIDADVWEVFRSIGRRIEHQEFEAFQELGEQCDLPNASSA